MHCLAVVSKKFSNLTFCARKCTCFSAFFFGPESHVVKLLQEWCWDGMGSLIIAMLLAKVFDSTI